VASPEATRGWGLGRGVPSPTGVGSGEGAVKMCILLHFRYYLSPIQCLPKFVTMIVFIGDTVRSMTSDY